MVSGTVWGVVRGTVWGWGQKDCGVGSEGIVWGGIRGTVWGAALVGTCFESFST